MQINIYFSIEDFITFYLTYFVVFFNSMCYSFFQNALLRTYVWLSVEKDIQQSEDTGSLLTLPSLTELRVSNTGAAENRQKYFPTFRPKGLCHKWPSSASSY